VIAVDTSVIVAIAISEDDADMLAMQMSGRHLLVGARTILELGMVLNSRLTDRGEGFISDFLQQKNLEVVPFDLEMALMARAAFRRHGKGQGKASGLNLGDCMSYALAKKRGVPLLFKGNDFIHTDITPAYIPA
jgi:ribonuclease VapC